jgi:hypothetical protein
VLGTGFSIGYLEISGAILRGIGESGNRITLCIHVGRPLSFYLEKL